MEGNVYVYQVNPVSRITGEGPGGVLKDVGGLILIKRGAEREEGGQGTSGG